MEFAAPDDKSERPRIVCVGGAVLDRKYRARKELIQGTSNPVDGMTSHGGVARNVAENLARLGARVSFVSAVGDDEAGRTLRRGLTELSVDISGVLVFPGRATAEYVAVLDPRNDLALGLADMAVFDRLTPPLLAMAWRDLEHSGWVFTDCNPPAETLAWLVARGRGGEFRLAVDTVSSPKSAKLPADLAGVSVLFTNVDEAAAMLGRAAASPFEAARALQARGAANVVVTDGGRGYAVAAGGDAENFPVVAASPVDITGAGDAMIAGTLFSMLSGSAIGAASKVGALVAALTIESTSSVRPDLSPALLEATRSRMIK
ncbi:MAG: carbohydrate kinase family protein [Rhizobiaceae bacterium]|nr:carbohydrate kinase family protein [Rhizobiaceae bacterium]